MATDTMTRRWMSGTGFLAMFGGILMVLVFVGLGVLSSGSQFLPSTFSSFIVVPFLLLAPAAVGLDRHHGDRFGLVAHGGTVLLVVGMFANVVNGLAVLLTGDTLFGDTAGFVAFLAVIAGSLVLGAAVAHAGELAHARSGGGLVAVGLLLGFVFAFGVGRLNVEVPLLAVAVLYSLPYGTGWVLVGYDLLSEGDTGMPGPEADLQA